MSEPAWTFKPQVPGDTTRDPISGEFFATEAIKDSAEALVREGIQNSLDARSGNGPVRVSIHLFDADEAAAPDQATRFLEGLAPHLTAQGNGLRPASRPRPGDPCRFLVFEDFGTTGLSGDPLQWHKLDGVSNNFYAFFRAEGESAKSEAQRRGRWGIGKFVFPRASDGSAFFGLTVRSDDQRALLLGRSILKSHDVDGVRVVPDGYFGLGRDMGAGRLIVPIEDSATIAAFAECFRLARGREPGLSLVVPWFDRAITAEGLLEAAVKDWFYSILCGDLIVTVGNHRLDATSLDRQLARLSEHARKDLEPLVGLARFRLANEGGPAVVLGAADTTNAPKWTDDMLSGGDATSLRQQLDARAPVGVRVPLIVKKKSRERTEAHFDIYLVRDDTADDGCPVFVREGVIVSDAKGSRVRGCRSLVVIDPGPLADLLGDAEGPAHTEWRSDTANFKEKYLHGPGYLTFVKQAVRALMERIEGEDEAVAPDLLIDLFSLPEEVGGPPRREANEEAETGDTPEPRPRLDLPRLPPSYRVSRIEGGFTLTSGAAGAKVPAELEVEIAYDVRRGDPFKKYDTADFKLFEAPIRIAPDHTGLAQVNATANGIHLRVTAPVFRMTIAGFDVNRDLIVRVTPQGEFGDDEAA